MGFQYVMPDGYPTNLYNQVPPTVGGTVAVFSQSFVFGNTGDIVIANLPKGSAIVDVAVHLITAFDSVTSAVLNVGTVANPDAFVDAFNLKGTAGTTRSNTASGSTVVIGDLFTAVDEPVDIVSNITTVGDTTAGAVRVVLWYTTS